MTRIAHYLLLHLLVFICSGQAVAESKRVQVYQLSQQTWDVRPGDTLSGISAALLPGAYRQQQALMQDIMKINPHAFIDNNPDMLRAYARLILPDELQTYSLPSEGSTTHVQQFSWGSIQRREQ